MVTLLAPDFASLAYIASNMRQADRDEIYNVIGHNNPYLLAQQTLDASRMGSAVVAARNSRPVAVMGFVVIHPGVGTMYAYATRDFYRVALTLTKYAIRVMRPAMMASGLHRVQCQSRFDHHSAHGWLELLGFKRETVLRQFGADRSNYIQYYALKDWFDASLSSD